MEQASGSIVTGMRAFSTHLPLPSLLLFLLLLLSIGGGDGRNVSPFPEEVSSKEPLPRKYFNKLLLE